LCSPFVTCYIVGFLEIDSIPIFVFLCHLSIRYLFFLCYFTESIIKSVRMNKSQQEYIYRINKVVDYIETHLDEELTLEVLSGVANFSPYHFHRIFTIFTGETLNDFVKRARLEKAGRLLLTDNDRPVNEIADYCGFRNFPVFCRNFREWFGMSAQKFRENKRSEFSKNGQSDRAPWRMITFVMLNQL